MTKTLLWNLPGGWLAGLEGGNSRDTGVTGGTMGESAKEANVDTVGVT